MKFGMTAMMNPVAVLVITLGILLNTANLADGACGASLGTASPDAYNTYLGSNTNMMFFDSSAASVSDCCGFLSSIRFYALNTGTVTAMLWRLLAGTNYELVYEHPIIVNASDVPGISSVNLKYPIEVNDVLGWHAATEIIPHDTGSSEIKNVLRGSVVVGSALDWSQPANTTVTYAWGYSTTANNPPTGTDDAVTIAPDSPVGFSVHTVAVSDLDGPGFPLTLDMTTTSSEFDFNTATGEITVKGPLTAGTKVLDITVADHCDTVTFQITINVENNPPQFTNCSVTATVSDSVTTAVKVHSFQVTDTDLDNCDLDPAVTGFQLQGTAPNYEIHTVNGVTLDASDPPYILRTECVDLLPNAGQTCTVTVSVINTPLTVSAITDETGTGGSINDLTVIDTLVGSFDVTDSAADQGNINCVLNPVNPDFSLAAGTYPAWSINLVAANTVDADATPTITLTVDCTDGVSTESQTVTFTITDGTPVVTLPPATATINTGTQTATNILAFTCVDRNDACTCTTDNAAYFEVVGSFNIATKDAVDIPASEKPQITLTVTCTDGPNTVVNTTLVTFQGPTFDPGNSANYPTAVSDNITDPFCFTNFNVSETDMTCTLDPANANYEIVQRAAPDTDVFDICLSASGNPNFDVEPTATLTKKCTDPFGTEITEDYVINYFDEPPTTTVPPDATYGPISDVSDPNPSPLGTFTLEDSDDLLTCLLNPVDANFAVTAQTGTGPITQVFEVSRVGNHNLDSAAQASHTLQITCNDGVTNDLITHTVVVDLENAPAAFQDDNSVAMTIGEEETAETCLHTVQVADNTDVDCQLSSTVDVPGIILKPKTPGPPLTEYEICVQDQPELYKIGPSTMVIDVSCHDGSSLIKQPYTLTITDEQLRITSGACLATSISEGEMNAVPIYTITTSQGGTCTLANDFGGLFALTPGSAQVFVITKTAGTNLEGDPPQSYLLYFDCDDGNGLPAVSGSCSVTAVNAGPDITKCPSGFTVKEGQADIDELILSNLETIEQANDCYQVGVGAPFAGFVVKIVPGTPNFALYKDDITVLKKEVQSSYDIPVECVDTSLVPGLGCTIQITIEKNEAPVESTLPETVTVDVKTTGAGAVIHPLSATDAEGNDITFTLTSCDPTPCDTFEINAAGEVVTKGDMTLHRTRLHRLCIATTDKYNPGEPCQELVVLVDTNDPPSIKKSLTRSGPFEAEENSPAGTVVHTVVADDDDTDDTHTFTCAMQAGAEAYFECDENTGEIKVKAPFNYEEAADRQFWVDVTANDGYEDSDTERIYISLIDVNEPPEFDRDSYQVNIPGEGVVDKTALCPIAPITVLDEDAITKDPKTFSLTCPDRDAGVFAVDKNTGCIYMSAELDLDEDQLPSRSFSCTLRVTDSEGEFDEAQVILTVNDENDNPPYFTQRRYDFCHNDLPTFNAIDIDVLDPHKELTYSFVGGDSNVLAVNGGSLAPARNFENDKIGTAFETVIRVEDPDGNYDEAPVSIVVCPPQPPVTTVVPPPDPDPTTSTATDFSVVWIALLAILGALGLGLLLAGLLYWCWRRGKCCCKSSGSGKKSNPRYPKVRRVTPEKPKPGPIEVDEKPNTHYYGRNLLQTGSVVQTGWKVTRTTLPV